MKKMALLYVTDSYGYTLTLHALSSFVLTQEPEYDIFLFCKDFLPVDVELTKKQCANHGFSLTVTPVSNAAVNNIPTKGHVTSAAFMKFICVLELKDRYERVLYADNDILFFEPIKLSDFDFQGHALAAVIDVAECSGITDSTFAETCVEYGVSNKYFNSGFMYFNCSELRRDSTIQNRYFEYLAMHQKFCWYKKNCRTNDQCVLNKLFNGKWALLPLTYNMQAFFKYTSHWSQAKVRHYQGKRKFLPAVLWRDDTRGIKLVNRTQQFLGYKETRVSPFGITLYWMNAIRQWRSFLVGRNVLKTMRNTYGAKFF